MIVNKDMYECTICNKYIFFDTSKEYKAICPNCGRTMTFIDNYDCDTDLEEQRKNLPPYDPTKDPNSPYYIPVIQCPYCQSTNTSKISTMSRVVSTGVLGLGSKKIGKQYHCNKCNNDF